MKSQLRQHDFTYNMQILPMFEQKAQGLYNTQAMVVECRWDKNGAQPSQRCRGEYLSKWWSGSKIEW